MQTVEQEVDLQKVIQAEVEKALKAYKANTNDAPKKVTGYSINDTVSQRLRVKDLLDDEVVVYKLLNAGKINRHITDEEGRPKITSPALYRMVGRELITDPGDGNRKKAIKNVVGYTPVLGADGIYHDQEIVAPIEFNKQGFCEVSKNDFGKYCFLERSSKNASNKFRSKSVPARYERINIVKDVEKAVVNMELEYDAIEIIRNAAIDLSALKVIVGKIPDNIPGKPSLDLDQKAIKLALMNIARKNPKLIINASPDVKMKAKAQIMDAEDAKILEYSEERMWFLEGPGGELSNLCEVPVGNDKYDYLVTFWMDKANKASYMMMKRKLDELK